MGAMILANISSMMSFGYISLYLADLGAGVSDIGTVFTITSLVPLVLQIVGGWLSDSIGRLKTIAIGSVAGVIGAIGLWLAPSWEWTILAIGIGSISMALVGPSFSSFIADQTEEENRGKVFGITQSLYQVVGVVGPPVGGYIAQNYSYKSMYFVSMLLYSVAAIVRIWMANSLKFNTENNEKPTVQSFKKSIKTLVGLILSGGVVTWMFLADGTSDIAIRLSDSLSTIFQQEIGGQSIQEIGLLTSIQAVVMMIFNIPGGWLSDKFGERVGVSIGFFLFATCFFIFIPATEFWQYALAWIISGIGASLLMPAYESLISKMVPEKMRGIAFGFFRSTLGIISFPAPLIGAALWERYSPQTPFLFTAYMMIVVGIVSWFKLNIPKNGIGQSESPLDGVS
mgnify:FL=1